MSLIKQSYKVCAGAEPCAEPSTADTVSGGEESFQEFVNQSSVDYDENDSGETWDLGMCDNFKHDLALFYLKLQAKFLLPATVVQKIAEEITQINGLNLEYVLSTAKQKLSLLGLCSESVNSILDELKGSDLLSLCNQTDFRNDYIRKKFFKNHFHYVEPTSFVLGTDDDRKECFGYYVPVKETIKSLFKHQSVREQYANPIVRKDGVLSDVTHGSVFCSNAFFQNETNAIKIILYQDAFEIVNPLGSARKKHKLLAVYMTLADLYPHHRSTVDQLQLVLLCKEKDLKTFGWEKVLAPLIQDLKEIESAGVTIFDDVVAKGSVVCVCGDNLGSHSIGGFFESFFSSHFCRYCLISRSDFLTSCLSTGESRTVENYGVDVQNAANCGGSHGVKCDSVLNKLAHYHVSAPGLPPCLGHDLFEGVVDLDLFLYIRHMIHLLKWFSLDYLNRRIRQFPYIGEDAANKPSPVNLKGDRLGGHAVQNWCL